MDVGNTNPTPPSYIAYTIFENDSSGSAAGTGTVMKVWEGVILKSATTLAVSATAALASALLF